MQGPVLEPLSDLWVEESRQPELVGSSACDPAAELLVPVQQLAEPKAQRG